MHIASDLALEESLQTGSVFLTGPFFQHFLICTPKPCGSIVECMPGMGKALGSILGIMARGERQNLSRIILIFLSPEISLFSWNMEFRSQD